MKSEFNNTKSDTLYAAVLPQARAILQSDSLRASTSFTPSPTIDTVCPNLFNSLIIILFWNGVTLPNIVVSSTHFFNSSSVSLLASTYLSKSNPNLFTILLIVLGLSPDIIFISTPSLVKYFIVFDASSLSLSSKRIKPITLLFSLLSTNISTL